MDLKIEARLDENNYEQGRKINDEMMKKIKLKNCNCLAGSSKIGKYYVVNNIFKSFTGLYDGHQGDF